jgi:hypothetical protein
MAKRKKKPKIGRPKVRGGYSPQPIRAIGRMSDEDWEILKEAAEAKGLNFTVWATATLLKAARRELK